MNDAIKATAAGIGAIAIVMGIGWVGLSAERPMDKYGEETRKEVYDTSRQYEQGTNRDIARYCEQMRNADNQSARKAVAELIRSNLSTYDGLLTRENETCSEEAKGI